MQNYFKITLLFVFALLTIQTVQAQKKTQKFTVTRVIPHSADAVWAIVGEDYGAIAHSHPQIVSSEYINGTLKAGEGAERVCHFNEKGTQYLKEKMINYNPAERTFVNTVFQAGKFPVDPEYTRAIYKVEPIDANSSRFVFDMEYRTKPAFMGGMMKGKFEKLINEYAIAIEHHITTGEKVNKDNFKDIKKNYKSK